MTMKKEIFFIVASIAIYSGCDLIEGSSSSYREQGPYDTVVVFSLSKGCWKTKRNSDKLRRELEEAGIVFTEYFVNEDREALEQLRDMVRDSEPEVSSYTIPAVDVNGNLLLNNPSLEEITSYFN
jgi:hypothetical protein